MMQSDISALIDGFQRFRNDYFTSENPMFKKLVNKGQQPKALVISCSDSRVDPAFVLGCQPGDLFVIRNVANLVPPYEDDQAYHGTSAALEFAVCVLNVKHIIVFGHTHCGGIQALLEHTSEKCGPNSFLTKWMSLAKAAHTTIIDHHAEKSLQEKVTLCGQYSLINSLKMLQTFPWILERLKQNTLSLHAWNFDMSRGLLEKYDEKLNEFKVLLP